jgi:hypothetical protein
MVNEIIFGVQKKLIEEFGADNYDICTENPGGNTRSGGEVKPCLFVTNRIPRSGSVRERRFTNRQLLGNRYMRTVGLCIEYRPTAVRVSPAACSKPGAIQEECAAVLERLFICLEYIEINGGLLRGDNMQGEYSSDKENVLNFFISYDVFVEQVETKSETMGALRLSSKFNF